MCFNVPKGYDKTTKIVNGEIFGWIGTACWFTNLNHKKRNEYLTLYRRYNSNDYQKYDNYDAIDVSKVTEIPLDYKGLMGVPITFLDKHNPEQFEIIGLIAGNIRGLAGMRSTNGKDGPYINGKLKYGRIIIRNKTLSRGKEE